MKCKAQEVQSREALRKVYREMGEIILSFLDVSTGCVLHDFRGFGKKRLQQAFDITSAAINDCMTRMAADGEAEDETILTVIWKFKRELKACGFDYDAESEALAFSDPFERTWHTSAEKSKHTHRSEFVKRMRHATDAYYLSLLDYAHTELKYGKGRLHDLYAVLREDFNKFLGAYLMCKPKGDTEAQKMLKERQKRIEEIGLKLIEF